MARVTATDVSAILQDTELTDDQILVYITSANTLVNTALGTAENDNLKEIERWLAAHLIAISRERQAIKEEAGTAKVVYSGTYTSGLDSTSYGQMVMVLDTTGKMRSLMRKQASIYAVKS